MFTARNIFSINFVASAVSGELTLMVLSIICEYRVFATLRHFGVNPPITFGILETEKSLFPGSSRSGEYAKKKSLPATKPDVSKMGLIISFVVPG